MVGQFPGVPVNSAPNQLGPSQLGPKTTRPNYKHGPKVNSSQVNSAPTSQNQPKHDVDISWVAFVSVGVGLNWRETCQQSRHQTTTGRLSSVPQHPRWLCETLLMLSVSSTPSSNNWRWSSGSWHAKHTSNVDRLVFMFAHCATVQAHCWIFGVITLYSSVQCILQR